MGISSLSKIQCLLGTIALSASLMLACSSSSGGGIDARDGQGDTAAVDTGHDSPPDHMTSLPEAGSDLHADVGGTGGTGGHDAGADLRLTGHDGGQDAAADMRTAMDAPRDVPSDIPVDGGEDRGPGTPDVPIECGTGCPSTVQPQALVLWLSADSGLTCTGNPSRVSGWADRAQSGRVFNPPSGKVGPACGVHSIAGKGVPFFDRPTTGDADNGILSIDLSALVNSEHTVFVVERRQAGNSEAYMLGTTVKTPGDIAYCVSQDNSYQAYRFGYQSSSEVVVGAFAADASGTVCADIVADVPAFSASSLVTRLDVDRFSATNRSFYTGTTLAVSVDDQLLPITSLMAAYLGRAYQLVTSVTPDSRFDGDIAEVVIYNLALDDTDRLAVSSYLMSRWGASN